MKRAIAPLAVLLAVLAAGFAAWANQWAAREVGRIAGERDSVIAAIPGLVAAARRVDTVYRDQVRTFTRWRDALRVERESLTITDTLEVIRYVATADSAIAACGLALRTCDDRVTAVWAVVAAERRRADLNEQLERRPWTSAGLAWDPHAGRVGGYLERDWWRFRAGVSAVPAEQSVRLELRIGWRW